MRITGETTLNSILENNEEKMINTLTWLAPELVQLQSPNPRRSIVGRISVEQAARIAKIPLAEMLYVLNLAAGETDEQLTEELGFEEKAQSAPRKSGDQVEPNVT